MAETPGEVRHVVFDLGGVLIGHVRSWREAHERTSLPWDDHFASPEFFEATRPSVIAHMSGRIAPEEWYAEVARISQGRLAPDDARLVLEAWLYGDYPGVCEVVEAIHAAGRTTATLSNTNPVHWTQAMAASAVLQMIRHPHASHLLGEVKPDRAIFEAFERETGFARPEVLFFDDLEENVAAATDFGWRAELIDHTGDTAAQLRAHLGRHGVLRG